MNANREGIVTYRKAQAEFLVPKSTEFDIVVRHLRDLTVGGRKVLLSFDGYRSHMGLGVMEYLDQNGVVVYTLPKHSSRKDTTQ